MLFHRKAEVCVKRAVQLFAEGGEQGRAKAREWLGKAQAYVAARSAQKERGHAGFMVEKAAVQTAKAWYLHFEDKQRARQCIDLVYS